MVEYSIMIRVLHRSVEIHADVEIVEREVPARRELKLGALVIVAVRLCN